MAGPHYTPSGPNKKVGSRPLIRSTRFRAKLEYIPAARQKQDKGTPLPPILPKSRNPLIIQAFRAYSRTWIFFFAHISFKILGHTLTVTSPRCAFLKSSISVRDWPIPPPMLSGISFFKMAW
jgi:hypothetical protein